MMSVGRSVLDQLVALTCSLMWPARRGRRWSVSARLRDDAPSPFRTAAPCLGENEEVDHRVCRFCGPGVCEHSAVSSL